MEPLLKGLNAAFVRLSSDQAQPHHTVTYQALLRPEPEPEPEP